VGSFVIIFSMNMQNNVGLYQEAKDSNDPTSGRHIDAVRNENANLRYLAGNDVEQWLESKRNMSDEEFYKIMKQNLMI
jgi:hypothetical protein